MKTNKFSLNNVENQPKKVSGIKVASIFFMLVAVGLFVYDKVSVKDDILSPVGLSDYYALGETLEPGTEVMKSAGKNSTMTVRKSEAGDVSMKFSDNGKSVELKQSEWTISSPPKVVTQNDTAYATYPAKVSYQARVNGLYDFDLDVMDGKTAIEVRKDKPITSIRSRPIKFDHCDNNLYYKIVYYSGTEAVDSVNHRVYLP